MADERDKFRAMVGLPPLTTKDPVVVGGTPFGQAGSATPSTVTGSFADQYGAPTETVVIDGKSYTGVNPTKGRPPAATTIGMVSPSSGLTITGTERNAAKEAEARAIGMTKEYIASRGGINAQGYFNDTPISGQLTAEEQKQVRKPDGTTDTNAMAAVLIKKQYDEAIAAGANPADTVRKLQGQYGDLFNMSILPTDATGGMGGLGTSLTGLSFFGDLPGMGTGGTTTGGTGTGGTTLSAGLPGAGVTGPTLAKDVFKTTLGLFFGAEEIAKPWVDQLYTSMSKFYKTGATIDESYNLALQDVRNNPEMADFTKRFKGIYDLQDLRQAGKPVTVPTVAEYVGTQSKMADVLRASNLGELATEEFLTGIIGKAIPASVFAERVTKIFDRIDFAPNEVKETIKANFPNLTRTQIAKAIIGGEKSTKELAREIAGYEVLTAAQQQGLGAQTLPGGVTVERATELGAMGETYQSALGKFGRVAQALPTATKLAGISGTEPLSQADLENIVFKNSVRETQALEELTKAEEARFAGKAGTIGSKSFASQARGAGLI
jgi:hypothetical protein